MKAKELNAELEAQMAIVRERKDWHNAVIMSMDVEFLEGDEYSAYAMALFAAMQWGRTVR